jgi:hypothetical protein
VRFSLQALVLFTAVCQDIATRQEVLHLQEEMKKLTLKSEYLTQIIVDLTQKSHQLLLLLSGEPQKLPLLN